MADDALNKHGSRFARIEAMHDGESFGRVLDAGTGPKSLRWVRSVASDGWAAVTGDKHMMKKMVAEFGDQPDASSRLVLGNWNDPGLLASERFDTVLADHLLGAIDGFAPYFQTALFPRLRAMTTGRLYVTGMEPYVVDRPDEEGARLVWQIGRYRDACLLLLGKQPYREFPRDWVVAELERSGFRVTDADSIPLAFQAPFVAGQMTLVRPGLERMADKALGAALIARGEALQQRALAHIAANGPLRHGATYVIAAEPVTPR